MSLRIPNRDQLKIMLDCFSKFFSGVGGVATAVAVGWGIYVYFEDYADAVKKDRIDKTLDFVDRFSSDRLIEAQARISAAWLKAQDQVQKVRADAKNTPGMKDEQKRAAVVQLQISVIQSAKLEPRIWAIIDFYDALWICISAELCDQETANRFFLDYASRFVDLHWAYIDSAKDIHGKSYAKGLYAYAGVDS